MTISVGPEIQVPVPPPAPIVLRERWVWLSPSGAEIELTRFADDVEIERGMSGRYMPPLRVTRDVVPSMAGQRTREVVHDMREIALPIVMATGGPDELKSLISALTRYMDPARGPGVLRHIARDGTVSELTCRYSGGLELSAEGASGPILQRTNLVFQADDPYWYGDIATQKFKPPSGTSGWFPFPPLRLRSSAVIGEVLVNANSDVETWPTWTIVGPGDNPELINNTTGKSTALQVSLSAGQKVVIDTRPGVKTVTGPDGSSWRRYLTQKALWSLVPGVNEISIALPNADLGAGSYMALSYRPASLVPGVANPDLVPAEPTSPFGPSAGAGTYSSTYGGTY